MLRGVKQKFGTPGAPSAGAPGPAPVPAPAKPAGAGAPVGAKPAAAATTAAPYGAAGGLARVSSGLTRPQSSKGPAGPPFSTKDITAAYAEALPSFRDVPPSERQALFVKKLHLCTYTFDFQDANAMVREKEVKRQTLLELVDYVNVGQGKFTEAVQDDIHNMLVSNLFRALPPPSHTAGGESFEAEEEEPALEPAWPHLQITYEFLLRYVVSNETDAKVAKKYIDNSFVLRLLELFDSEDPRERDYLKTILHRIYGKFMVHRPFIRKAINHIFYRFIFETDRHNGVAELLEILGSIINGFALPLKEEHKMFLMKALMPLHKPKCVSMYHQQLSYCVTQFVEKDPKLAEPVLRGLLKFWPLTNSQKEVLFIGELEEILELSQAPEFAKVMVPVFKQVAKCLNSSHFQVAERALFLWNNEYVVSLVAQNRHAILPCIFQALETNSRAHWNATVHGLTLNVKKMFVEMDAALYEECERKQGEEDERAKELSRTRDRNWERLQQAAAKAK